MVDDIAQVKHRCCKPCVSTAQWLPLETPCLFPNCLAIRVPIKNKARWAPQCASSQRRHHWQAMSLTKGDTHTIRVGAGIGIAISRRDIWRVGSICAALLSLSGREIKENVVEMTLPKSRVMMSIDAIEVDEDAFPDVNLQFSGQFDKNWEGCGSDCDGLVCV